MRANLATSIGVATAAALLLPLAPLAAATGDPAPVRGTGATGSAAEPQASGSTQSLTFPASGPTAGEGQARTADAGPQEIGARTVRPYAMLGVVWEDGNEEFHGTVHVRTRDADTGRWSGWQELDSHAGDVPGREPGERAGSEVRGSTAPLWVGDSDGVQARIQPDRAAGSALPGHEHGGASTDGGPRTGGQPGGAQPAEQRPTASQETAPQGSHGQQAHGQSQKSTLSGSLPQGLRLELIDPGPEPGARQAEPGTPQASGEVPSGAGGAPGAAAGGADAADANEGLAEGDAEGGTALPALTREATAAEYGSTRPFLGPRPRIVTRKGWGADERIREPGAAYTQSVRAAFVHHTAMSNNYSCTQAPSMIRGMYRYHVLSSKWRDIGYNFLVDKCGTVYEGRSGGVAKPVMGAHTYGFNTNSTGIAVLGSYDKEAPSAAAVDALSRLTAWKLGLMGVNPGGTTTLTSGGGKYEKGKTVRFQTISGHRDGFNTACPGALLYGKLGATRTAAAQMQGR